MACSACKKKAAKRNVQPLPRQNPAQQTSANRSIKPARINPVKKTNKT